jgi:hypothetical protein
MNKLVLFEKFPYLESDELLLKKVESCGCNRNKDRK